jgi:hypothetical protein
MIPSIVPPAAAKAVSVARGRMASINATNMTRDKIFLSNILMYLPNQAAPYIVLKIFTAQYMTSLLKPVES